MRVAMLGLFRNQTGQVTGIRMYDLDNNDFRDKDLKSVEAVLSQGKMEIKGLKYDKRSNKLKPTLGSLDDYNWSLEGTPFPIFYKNTPLKENFSIIVLEKLGSYGYTVGTMASVKFVTEKELATLISNTHIPVLNATMTRTPAGGFKIELVKDTYFNVANKDVSKDIIEASEQLEDKTLEAADAELGKQAKTDLVKSVTSRSFNPSLPKVVSGTGRPRQDTKLYEVDPVTNMTLEQKMTFAIMSIKMARPFYFTVINMVERVEARPEDGIPTAAVSTKKLFFNPDFMLKITSPEISFTLIHEAMHLILKHRARQGSRDAELWNIACDYFINSVIADEFKISRRGEVVLMDPARSDTGKLWKITLPSWVLYNDKVDIKVDTPEKIYDEIMNSVNQNMKQQAQQGDQGNQGGQGQGNQGQGQSGQGNQSQGNQNGQGQGQQSGQGKPKQGKKQNGQGNQQGNQQGQGQQGQGQGNQQGNQYNFRGDSGSFNPNPQGGQGQGGAGGSGSGQGGRKSRFEGANFRGQPVHVSDSGDGSGTGGVGVAGGVGSGGDMVDDKSDPITSQDTLDQESDSFIRRAVEMFKLSSKSKGGEMGAFMERLIEEALAPKINWRTLLRNRLVKSSTMIYTYSKPDKRFLARKMTLPGPKPMDPDSLENIKLCIDTSGSISDKDLGVALAQIKQLFDSYKADAELLYWDTQVRAVYPFKNIQELIKCKPMGGGGTDGNCIFEYFETNIDYVRRRKKKPSTIVVFTDGYIGDLDMKYKSKYRDVIWIVSENGDPNFKPNFGIVAPFNPK